MPSHITEPPCFTMYYDVLCNWGGGGHKRRSNMGIGQIINNLMAGEKYLMAVVWKAVKF